MKKFCFFLFTLIAFSKVLAQPNFVTDSLDKYIEDGMKHWSIPGLAITVVHNGKVEIMKGYGVSNLQTGQAVDENTLFMIASNSKLFTGTALAQLEYNKKLSLDDKITKYYPNFKAFEETTTSLVTIKDMLTHRIGTKTFQGDFTFWSTTLSRKQIMQKMRLLKPNYPFRSGYGYCNSCFLTAGEIIPSVTNKPWEVYVYDSILKPLQLNNTYTLGGVISNLPNVALPYSNSFSGKLVQLPFDAIDNFAPAASMVSCVKDMATWLQFQLDSGKANGKQVIPWQVLQKTREGVNLLSTKKTASRSYAAYGLGVFINDYYGKQVFSHTGGANGYVTNTCFIPEMNLGISILTNNDNQNFFELLRMQIIDAYLNRPYQNKSLDALPAHIAENQETVNKIFDWEKRVAAKNKTPLSLKAYAGVYQHPLYGSIEIEVVDNHLEIDFKNHKYLTAILQYMDKEEWLITYTPINYGVFTTKFEVANKAVKSIQIKVSDFIEYDAYIFEKKL